jgi:hypothetical protein
MAVIIFVGHSGSRFTGTSRLCLFLPEFDYSIYRYCTDSRTLTHPPQIMYVPYIASNFTLIHCSSPNLTQSHIYDITI